MTEKYFVASSTDIPLQIYFNKKVAFASKLEYIDSFDENGEPVQSYKYEEIDGKCKYTTDF